MRRARCRTPQHEWSARCRGLYPHKTTTRQTSMPQPDSNRKCVIKRLCHLLRLCGVGDERMSLGHWWITWTGRKPKCSESHVCHCHILHRRLHIDWRGVEPGPPWWEAGDYSPEPWHCRIVPHSDCWVTRHIVTTTRSAEFLPRLLKATVVFRTRYCLCRNFFASSSSQTRGSGSSGCSADGRLYLYHFGSSVVLKQNNPFPPAILFEQLYNTTVMLGIVHCIKYRVLCCAGGWRGVVRRQLPSSASGSFFQFIQILPHSC